MTASSGSIMVFMVLLIRFSFRFLVHLFSITDGFFDVAGFVRLSKPSRAVPERIPHSVFRMAITRSVWRHKQSEWKYLVAWLTTLNRYAGRRMELRHLRYFVAV